MGNWFSSVELEDLTSEQANDADEELKKMNEIQKQLSDHKTECDIKFDYIEELKNNVHFRRRYDEDRSKSNN